jgi:hypothetical protein
MKEALLLANSIPSKKTTSRPTPVRDDMRWAAEATNLVRISRSTGTNLRIIVNSRSKSFERLEQKQGTEMQVYISGESPEIKTELWQKTELKERKII